MHAKNMPKMVQIRNVPDVLHARLRTRAALAGMSLSDYLQGELARLADQLTPAELRARLDVLEPVPVTESAADILRRERDAR
jgi:plasmid stability protein